MSSGGGAIWTIVAATAAGTAAQAARASALDQELSDTSDGPYRPAGWQDAPLVTITVPGNDPGIGGAAPVVNGSSASLNAGGGQAAQADPNLPGGFKLSTSQGTSQIVPDQIYVFDAVIRTEHQRRITKTQHPIQTGANVTDHAIIEPARVELEIGMSDAMDSFIPGQWSGDHSKSVNAYLTLKTIAAARQPLTVTTRLDSYTNMVLTGISAGDTVETRFGLKASLVFEELFTGTISSQQVSARPDLTGSTNLGTKSPLPVSSDISRYTHSTLTTVPNAGVLSSNPVTK
jgi:hypothetical protein